MKRNPAFYHRSTEPKTMSCRKVPRIEGSCLCGSIHWSVSDANVSQICVCHCSSCRRSSGGTELPYCAIDEEQIWPILKDNPTLRSCISYCSRNGSTVATTDEAPSRQVVQPRRFFCGKCSTSVAVECAQGGRRLWIPIGTLKDFDPSVVDPLNDFHASCDEKATFASALSNLKPRCNELLIRTMTYVTALRLALILRIAVFVRWMILNAVSVFQYHSVMPSLIAPTPQRIVDHVEGSCECGSIRWQASKVVMSKVTVCHCNSCQKCSGTNGIPFCALDRTTMINSILRPDGRRPREQSVLGSYASSTIATRYFCSECASPVAFQYNQEADTLWIPMGSFSNFDPNLLDSSRDSHIFSNEESRVFAALTVLPKRNDSRRPSEYPCCIPCRQHDGQSKALALVGG